MRRRVVDLFAGWGGFSLGAQRAGCEVVYAANHWPLAVEVHARNHPHTLHECQDLRQADFTRLPAYDLLIASPACQGNSRASQPRRKRYHDAMRATAWSVVDCAEVTRPEAIIVENVLDLRRWCLYENWCGALRTLGYTVAEHIVQASRLGVPQRRLRLIVTATRRAIGRLELPCLDELPFEPCIVGAAAGWRLVRAAPAPVQERIARGRARLGRRFLSQHVTGHRGVPLTEPIRTITTKNHWLLVNGDAYRSLTERELARGMALPDTFGWPSATPRNKAIIGIGNAVPPPMAEHVVRAVMEAV
jgi:DNA (cytosine-5)-methyltransferase 1